MSVNGLKSASQGALKAHPVPVPAQAVVSNNPSTNPGKVPLTVFSYEDFERGDVQTMDLLKTALHEHGIFGIRGIPDFKKIVREFIESARKFSHLPEDVKKSCAPDPKDFLGYELGAEQFKIDGKWVPDDLKTSYYAHVPNSGRNKWPEKKVFDLQTPFQAIGGLMLETGKKVIEKIGILKSNPSISLAKHHVARMLYYRKSTDSQTDNPRWCGEHFDHGLLTALLPASYFDGENQIDEPEEAGLHVKTANDTDFKKVVADKDVMLFQIGEACQLLTNDSTLATKHRVDKAHGSVERYTMALFFALSDKSEIHSTSRLTKDKRFGEGKFCTYGNWHQASIARYKVN